MTEDHEYLPSNEQAELFNQPFRKVLPDCPFCGSSEIIKIPGKVIQCTECGGSMSVMMRDEYRGLSLEDKWSRRVK